MKIIGLIGGTSWESTSEYYRLLNRKVAEKLGGLHSAKVILYSVDFGPVAEWQHRDRWDRITDTLVEAATRLEKAGADFFLLCANTMHKSAPEVEASVGIPLLHIADTAAGSVAKRGLKTVGLLGTRFTMEEGFYRDRLKERHGLEVLVPDEISRQAVHDIIYKELCYGTINEDSRKRVLEVIADLAGSGAEGVILGCTELPLLVGQADTPIPLFDTMEIHAAAAVDEALADGGPA